MKVGTILMLPNVEIKVAFRLSGPTSQFLNGTHEFSELVLARMVLLMDQSRSVLPLRSSKAREFRELWRKNVRAHLEPFHFSWPEPVLFGRAERTSGKRPLTYLKKQQVSETWSLHMQTNCNNNNYFHNLQNTLQIN